MNCGDAWATTGFALLCATALGGCEPSMVVPAPSLTGVEPNVVPVDSVMTVDLIGEALYVRIINDIGRHGGVRTDDRFVADIGGVALTGIRWISNQQLEATLPVGLGLGSHDLQVTTPAGQTAVLEGAVTVCEDVDRDGVCDPLNACTDADGDGVGDGTNGNIDCAVTLVDSDDSDNTICADTDGDGCDDCTSTSFDVAKDGTDTDGDGQCNDGDDDDDGDTVLDTVDTDPIDPWRCQNIDNDSCDDCAISGGPPDPANDGVDLDGDGVCDAGDSCIDVDGDLLGNGHLGNVGCIDLTTDADDGVATVCADSDGDMCEDCLTGTFDPTNDGADNDSDGACDLFDADDDNDGVIDSDDVAPFDPMICGDSDADTCDDCAIGVDGFGSAVDADPANDGPDTDGNGLCDVGECGAIAAACCQGDGTFVSASPTTISLGAWTMKPADFNEDGITDLVTANRNDNSITILLTNGTNGRGDGSFTATRLDAGLRTYDVEPADLDRDGILDIAVANQDGQSVGVFWGRGVDGHGDGTFDPMQDFPFAPASPGPLQVVAADFNADGILDLATANELTVDVAVMLGGGSNGQGDRTFAAATYYGPLDTFPRSLVAADFNADGIVDLAVSAWDTINVTILLGDGTNGRGDGTFTIDQTYAAGTNQTDITTADFNEDGIVDLVVTSMNTARVHVLLGLGSGGRGDGTFGASTPVTTGDSPVSVEPADLDGDGILDLVVAEWGTGSVAVFLGNGSAGVGDGTFGTGVAYVSDLDPSAAVVLEVTGDGVPDIAVCNAGAASLTLFPGNGSGGLPDGSFVPASLVPGASNPTAVATADLNGDQILDLAVGYDNLSTIVTYLGQGGNGRGNATFVQQWTGGATGGRSWIHIVDIDGDNIPDLMTTKPADQAVEVYIGIAAGGHGTGDFNAPVLYSVGPEPNMVATADLNADGILDLIATTTAAGVAIRLGLGTNGLPTGTFDTVSYYPAGAGARRFALGDLNADGITDIVVANSQSDSVSVLLGGGVGGVGTGAMLPAIDLPVGIEPTHPVLADFDRDGVIDLAVANFGGSSIGIHLGNAVGGLGTGTFQVGSEISVPAAPVALMAVDLDADNRVDLVVLHGTAGSMTTLFGNGDGTFATPQTDNLDADPVAGAAGHFDGDQRLDLALADLRSNGLLILRGGGSCTPP